MATYEIQGLIWIDTDLGDGYVRVDDEIYMSLPTYRAVTSQEGVVTRLVDTLEDVEGTYLIPGAVLWPEAASDLRLGLSLVDPERSEHCAFQPCVLPATVDRPEGFSLCDHHDSLMRDWDDLVA